MNLGPDPLRDHLTGVCADDCPHCAKWLRNMAAKQPVKLLMAVAHAAWHLLDDSGEHDDEGLIIACKRNAERLSDALDALEARGWAAHPDDDSPVPPVPVEPEPRGEWVTTGQGAHGDVRYRYQEWRAEPKEDA